MVLFYECFPSDHNNISVAIENYRSRSKLGTINAIAPLIYTEDPMHSKSVGRASITTILEAQIPVLVSADQHVNVQSSSKEYQNIHNSFSPPIFADAKPLNSVIDHSISPAIPEIEETINRRRLSTAKKNRKGSISRRSNLSARSAAPLPTAIYSNDERIDSKENAMSYEQILVTDILEKLSIDSDMASMKSLKLTELFANRTQIVAKSTKKNKKKKKNKSMTQSRNRLKLSTQSVTTIPTTTPKAIARTGQQKSSNVNRNIFDRLPIAHLTQKPRLNQLSAKPKKMCSTEKMPARNPNLTVTKSPENMKKVTTNSTSAAQRLDKKRQSHSARVVQQK